MTERGELEYILEMGSAIGVLGEVRIGMSWCSDRQSLSWRAAGLRQRRAWDLRVLVLFQTVHRHFRYKCAK